MSYAIRQRPGKDSSQSHQRQTFNLNAPPPDLTKYIVRIGDNYVAGGAFGDVYKCRYQVDSSAPQEVAVKALRFRFDGDAENASVKMLRRELGIWKRLEHGNIVPFLGVAFGFGMCNTLSIVSLWMPNDSLHNFLATHDSKLDTVHRLRILLDVAQGLEYLHSLSVVHGDLSSTNVLLDANYTARLTDFGYATLVGNIPEALAYLQRSTTRPGALRWVAPERIKEATSHPTIESDIYSFGCIALQVLSGKHPWSEVCLDIAIVAPLMEGKNPGRPASRKIDDVHWNFIQLCWSPVRDRPVADKIITFIEQFIRFYPTSGPLRDLFIPSLSQVGPQVSEPSSSSFPEPLQAAPQSLAVVDTLPRADAEGHGQQMLGPQDESFMMVDFTLQTSSGQHPQSESHTNRAKQPNKNADRTGTYRGLPRVAREPPDAGVVKKGINTQRAQASHLSHCDGHIVEGVKCFQQMRNETRGDMDTHEEREQSELDFRQRSVEKLEKLGDGSMNSKDYNVAMEYYSTALSFAPTGVCNIVVKCCKVRADLLEEALIDATKAIELDPSSYRGYERKYSALHSMCHYKEAFKAFEVMLLKLDKSPDPGIRALRDRFMDVTPLIRMVVGESIRDIPHVLINMSTGRLYDKTHQAAAFEILPIYHELRSSMTTRDRLDYLRIQREVKMFYRYVMFSHKWQPYEPTFQTVRNGSIYQLPRSPTNNKLIQFCKIVRSRHFQWAWSDTCCVNQTDKRVQQESVIAMFRWYRGSSLTIIHLLGVLSETQGIGSLWRSIWNTRGWTYQEYVASEVVQFYTEDWKPYLGLDMFNHKQSPIILREMEQVTNITTKDLASLTPGLDRVREKLYLASKRQTTREEDIAYSLFGIFDVAIPVIYGEGKQAVRRLLRHILTRLDDVTLLSWTGISGTQNSYLPVDLTVYDQITPPHVPQPIEPAEMDNMVIRLRSSLPDLPLAVTLYERLYDLPSLSFVFGQLKLSGIVFPLADLTPLPERDSESDVSVYHGTAPLPGDVRIQTNDNLLGTKGLLLIHPWINSLVGQDFSHGVPQFDLATRALRLLVRLKQPFGALLLASVGRGRYVRVATDSMIMVQVREETTLSEWMASIRTVYMQ